MAVRGSMASMDFNWGTGSMTGSEDNLAMRGSMQSSGGSMRGSFNTMSPVEEAVPNKDEDEDFRQGLDALTLIAQERTRALADGVSSVLDEEMQSLERRQRQQQLSMEQMQAGLQAMRQLVTKLNQTCVEISELTAASSKSSSQQGRSMRISVAETQGASLAITDSSAPDASKSSDFLKNLAKEHHNTSATF